jgi:hypothetical protein
VAVNAVYSISPTTIANFNYGVNRRNYFRAPFSLGFDHRTIGLPDYLYNQAATLGLEFPRFNVGGNTNISSLGQATFTTLKDRGMGNALRGDVTRIMNNHTIKFGMEYRKLLLNFTQLGQPGGEFSFNSLWTQLCGRSARRAPTPRRPRRATASRRCSSAFPRAARSSTRSTLPAKARTGASTCRTTGRSAVS